MRADGTVERVEIEGVPGNFVPFRGAIEQAVRQWTFEPATRGGEAVPGVYQSRIRFELPDLPGARSYSRPPSVVWDAAQRVLKEWGFKNQDHLEDDGVLVTRFLRIRSPATMGIIKLENGQPIKRVQLHLYVPMHREKARVHLQSMVEAKEGLGNRLFYHSTAVAEEFYERLDAELGEVGAAVPGSARRRAMQDGGPDPNGCVEKKADPKQIFQTAEHMKKISAQLFHKIEPRYPESARRTRSEGFVIMLAKILTDGSLQNVRILNAGGNPEFDVSAAKTLRTWRYRPVIVDNCPANVYWTIMVSYEAG